MIQYVLLLSFENLIGKIYLHFLHDLVINLSIRHILFEQNLQKLGLILKFFIFFSKKLHLIHNSRGLRGYNLHS